MKPLLEKIDEPIDHFSGDGAHDESLVYDMVIEHSANTDLVVPPRANAVESDKSAPQRNRSIVEIKENDRIH